MNQTADEIELQLVADLETEWLTAIGLDDPDRHRVWVAAAESMVRVHRGAQEILAGMDSVQLLATAFVRLNRMNLDLPTKDLQPLVRTHADGVMLWGRKFSCVSKAIVTYREVTLNVFGIDLLRVQQGDPAGIVRRRASVMEAMKHRREELLAINPNLVNFVKQSREGIIFSGIELLSYFTWLRDGNHLWMFGGIHVERPAIARSAPGSMMIPTTLVGSPALDPDADIRKKLSAMKHPDGSFKIKDVWQHLGVSEDTFRKWRVGKRCRGNRAGMSMEELLEALRQGEAVARDKEARDNCKLLVAQIETLI